MNIVICWRRAVLMALLLIFAFYPIGARQTGQTGQTEKPRQSGEISGRVVTEDGNGVPNVMVNLFPASTGTEGRGQMAGRVSTVITDEEGKFRFADLAPRLYSVNVYQTGGYAVQPSAASDRRERRYYRIGENPTITLMKGGVITGKVTTVEGEPIVGVYVIAVMVRDDEGFKVRQGFGGRSRMTDDRGIYRLYGLAPGSYIVYAGSANYTQSPYSGSIPTYHPSSTRDTAAEVTVTNGSEATGVDIRYRDERGYVVSGTVSGGGETSQPYMLASVTLFNAATGTVVSGTPVRPGESDNGYAIGGVGDGEYEIIARQGGGNEETLSSLPRRVTVKGADVTGIELKLAPMASISGHVVLEKSENACEEKSRYGVEEILLSARRDDKVAGAAPSPQYFSNDVGVGDNGDFAIRYLMAGRYRFESSLPGETWYVKSITNKSAAPARRTAAASKSPGEIDISRAGITIKAGERLTGLTVTVSEGAASLRGKVVAEAEGALIPNRVRIHLVPAETAAADDVLRYGEALVGSDRTFTFKNLAPGRYWLLARIISNDEITDRQTLLLVWDGSERGKLRKEAEAKKSEIELKPCQRVTDYTLKY
jgi:Carboxypeptidase regulatory-like domain